MVDYPYEAILVADPLTFRRAVSASCTVYDVNDTAQATPLALKDMSGLPLPNPVTSTTDAFIPPLVTTSEGIKIVGGGLTVVVYSHQGLKNEAVAAREAAETAAASAGAEAVADVEARIAAGDFKGDKGLDGSNVLPTDDAIEQAVKTPGTKTATALNATYAGQSESRKVINMGELPGAVGDGLTDNTTVFQTAINSVGNGAVSTVFYFPEGTWLTDGLKLKSHAVIEGAGAGTFGLNSFNGSRTTVLKLKANATRPLIADYATDNLSSGVIIRDIQLDGNKANQTTAIHGIQQYPAASGQDPLWKINRVYIHDFKGDGIRIGLYRRTAKIIDCEVINNDGHGIIIESTDCTVQNCAIGQNGGNGIHYTGGLQHCVSNDIWGNTIGIYLGPVAQCAMIMNCGIDINRRHGISSEAPRTAITGCTFQTNGVEATDTYSHIDLGFPGTTAHGCTISSVVMRHDSTVSANKAKYGVQTNVPVNLFGVGYNTADVPWVSGLGGNPALLVLAFRSQGFLDGTTLHMGLGGAASGIKLGGSSAEKMAFWGATPIVRPTLTNAAATDLTTTTALVNELRSKLVSLGLVQ